MARCGCRAPWFDIIGSNPLKCELAPCRLETKRCENGVLLADGDKCYCSCTSGFKGDYCAKPRTSTTTSISWWVFGAVLLYALLAGLLVLLVPIASHFQSLA